jgi:hypothetical protein
MAKLFFAHGPIFNFFSRPPLSTYTIKREISVKNKKKIGNFFGNFYWVKYEWFLKFITQFGLMTNECLMETLP